ncbi:MAG: DUF3365 domain-containing protein [Planctomycetes bacterium]|nr:DUF3365 domain-containing protein [Planctomycetota bacterium]
MKSKLVLVLVAYIVAIGGMAWYSRQKAVDFARQEQRRQEELGAGYTPSGPRLNAMSGIFNPSGDGDLAVQAKAIAITVSQKLIEQLATQLQVVITEDGSVVEVDICGDVAQKIAADFSQKQGIKVRFTSLRVLNSLNTPDDFERPWLENAASSTADAPVDAYGEFIPATASAAAEYRHLSPIYLDSSHLQAALNERYPSDEGPGFTIGELRGAVSLRIPFALEGGDGVPEWAGDSCQRLCGYRLRCCRFSSCYLR